MYRSYVIQKKQFFLPIIIHAHNIHSTGDKNTPKNDIKCANNKYLLSLQLDQVYDPNNPEDDMEERYEEMSRMREHVMKELDKDGDKLVSMDEFMQYTKSDEFNKDEGWDVRVFLLKSSVSASNFVLLIFLFVVASKE